MSIFSANFRGPAPSGLSAGAQQPRIAPIPGTRKLHRPEENLGAVNVELTPEDLREIDEAVSEIETTVIADRRALSWSGIRNSGLFTWPGLKLTPTTKGTAQRIVLAARKELRKSWRQAIMRQP